LNLIMISSFHQFASSCLKARSRKDLPQMQSSISPNFGARPLTVPFIDSLRESFYGRIFLAISATAFVGVCAHVTLPLPYTPVPLVLSDFAVLLVGMALGPVAGFWAMVLYLAEGASGLPVFSPHDRFKHHDSRDQHRP
jgi:biotin transport system substrate-specific component